MRIAAPAPARPLALALAGLLLAGCAHVDAAPARPLDVAVLFSGGGRGDNGFNDDAVAGATRAAKDFGVTVHFVDPSADGESAMARDAAQAGANLVIGVGFQFNEPLQSVAGGFQHTRFIGVDMSYSVDPSGALRALPDNVGGIAFREDEGAFLVGALAAMSSPSHTVGFVGGMPNDVIKRFEDGYRSGVRNVCPSCSILVDYVGNTPAAFASPERARTLASAQFADGADVVFHAAGRSGHGVIDAAAHEHKLAIGADIDESVRAPGYVLTSMQKSVDVAIYETIKRAVQGHLEMGTLTTLGLAQNGVGYVYNERNRALITPAMHARVEQLRASIVNGRMATRELPMAMPTM
jgi:basic membrane protein A and related proteins